MYSALPCSDHDHLPKIRAGYNPQSSKHEQISYKLKDLSASSFEGELTGHTQLMTELRLAGAKFSKHFCDRSCFESVSEELVKFLAPCVNPDNLLPLLVVLGGCGESHWYKFSSSFFDFVDLGLAKSLNLLELCFGSIRDGLYLQAQIDQCSATSWSTERPASHRHEAIFL